MAAKNQKGAARLYAAMIGKTFAMAAFMIQCELEPRPWPLERTLVGKTSLR